MCVKIKTYCTDAQVADSACTATAYLCGVKTDIDTLGLDANVEYKNCDTQNNQEFQVSSVMDWAQVCEIYRQFKRKFSSNNLRDIHRPPKKERALWRQRESRTQLRPELMLT